MWCFCEQLSCFIAWLDRWQTLLSGGMALGAAVIAARLVKQQVELQKRQISEEQERANDARDRRGLSLRAKMPFALDELSKYAAECFEWSWTPPISASRVNPPLLPTNAVGQIAELIEFTDNSSARYLATLVAQCQILDARIQSASTVNEDNIVMSVIIRWLADSAFPFGRLEVDHYSLVASEADVRNALRIMPNVHLMSPATEAMVNRVLPRAVRFAQRLTAPAGPEVADSSELSGP